jgi:hypothetical protein
MVGAALGCSGSSFSADAVGSSATDSDAGQSAGGAGTAQGGASGGTTASGGSGKGGASTGGATPTGGASAGGAAGGAGTGGSGTGGTAPGGTGAGGAATGGAGAGGAATGGAGGAGNDCGVNKDTVQCGTTPQVFPQFDRGCSNDDNCAKVARTTSCCGDVEYTGINHAEQTCFQLAADLCDSQYPACGCASQGFTVDDGTLVPYGSDGEVVVQCVSGQCNTSWRPATFQCGDISCPVTERCVITNANTSGSPSYACTALPQGCTSCTCVVDVAAGCICDDNDGPVIISCSG